MKQRAPGFQFVIASHQGEQDVEDPDRVDGCNLESSSGILCSDNRLHQLLRHGGAKRLETMGVEKYAEPTRVAENDISQPSAEMRQKKLSGIYGA